MQQKHTPEPWKTGLSGNTIVNESVLIGRCCEFSGEANAKRIVECVNAMEGIENPQVYISRLAYERDLAKRERDKAETELISIRAQRDELLQAFELIARMSPNNIAGEVRCFHIARQDAMKVIAKLKGGSK